MKLKITLKDPDALNDEIENAVIHEYPCVGADIRSEKIEEIEVLTRKWFKYGEYVTIEIDTETGTAKILEV
jgi:hypothetical protein